MEELASKLSDGPRVLAEIGRSVERMAEGNPILGKNTHGPPPNDQPVDAIHSEPLRHLPHWWSRIKKAN